MDKVSSEHLETVEKNIAKRTKERTDTDLEHVHPERYQDQVQCKLPSECKHEEYTLPTTLPLLLVYGLKALS